MRGISARGAAAGAAGFQIIVTLERLLGSELRPLRNHSRRGLLLRRVFRLGHGDIEERLRLVEVHDIGKCAAEMPERSRWGAPCCLDFVTGWDRDASCGISGFPSSTSTPVTHRQELATGGGGI